MTNGTETALIAHTRVTVWGFLVALTMGCAFFWAALLSMAAPLMPARLGIFVEPPPWALGLAFLGLAVLLFLVGIAELMQFLKPSQEVIIDRDGIATIGLLGERRCSWRDVRNAEIIDDLLTLQIRQTGRLRPVDMRIHFSRLDVVPADLVAAIRSQRPDLLT
ncbi:MAG: hypothetical protein ACKVP7_03115 [Hyphomicrobiaceae bacterium]